MKHFIGIGIFGKQDMIRWILEGVAACFPPGRLHVYFEACQDNSEKNFDELAGPLLPGWTVTKSRGDAIINEGAVHCELIKEFMASDCDYLVVPHDDNQFIDPGIPGQIEKLLSTEKNVGWIGSRDGYGIGYVDMVSSNFSGSNIANLRVKDGEYLPRRMLNTGPVAYTRDLVNAIGMPDGQLVWYWWDDYSLRAMSVCRQNYLLGMNCKHEKFGTVQHNHELYKSETVAACLATFNKRWYHLEGRNIF